MLPKSLNLSFSEYWIIMLLLTRSLIFFSLVQVSSPKPKLWTKAEHYTHCGQQISLLRSPVTTHHLPKTFRRVLGFVWGQDSLCRLHIDQRAITPNFALLPQSFWQDVGPENNFGPKYPKSYEVMFWYIWFSTWCLHEMTLIVIMILPLNFVGLDNMKINSS